jgi:hypothetical protein
MDVPDALQPRDITIPSFLSRQGDVGIEYSGTYKTAESEQETISRLKRAELEKASLLRREEITHHLDLKIKFITFLCAMILIVGTSVICGVLISTDRLEVNKWAETTLTTIISAFLGYIVAKSKS